MCNFFLKSHFLSNIWHIYYISKNYYLYKLNTFLLKEIDGKALILLTTDILMKYMGFKLGPALKLNNYIDKLRKNLINLNGANTVSQKVKTECWFNRKQINVPTRVCVCYGPPLINCFSSILFYLFFLSTIITFFIDNYFIERFY